MTHRSSVTFCNISSFPSFRLNYSHSMGRHALSLEKRAQLRSEQKRKLYARAVTLYQQYQELNDGVVHGLRQVCKEVAAEYRRETGKIVEIHHTTVRNLLKGGRHLAVSNAEKSWLTLEETEAVISYALELALWGHPLDHRRLKEHVDEICRSRLGSKFPEEGVGKRWTYRFVARHSDRLHVFNASSLDTLRGQAVNPHSNKLYFDLMEELAKTGNDGKPMAPECMHAFDEIGFNNLSGGATKVIGHTGKKMQYQQRGANREMTTVLVTICADGTSIPPAMIFKGKGYSVKWQQNDPLNSMCVLKRSFLTVKGSNQLQ